MTLRTFTGRCSAVAFILAGTWAIGTGTHANEMAPPANVASPDVYAVVAENDQFRVLRATWQPGQEDNFHSHPADRVSLYRTDCTLQLTKPDGTSRVGKPKAGKVSARTGKPVPSHKAKNLGDDVCVIDIVELK